MDSVMKYLQPAFIAINIMFFPVFAGERELVEFLTEEILAERKAQKIKNVPTSLEGFAVKLNGAEVELNKQSEKEK